MDTGRNRGQMGHFGGRLASWRWKQSEEILPRYVFRAGFFRLKHSAHIGHVRHQVIEHMDHGVDELVEVPSSVDRKPLCCLARPESRTCAQLVQFLREFGGTGSSSVRAGMMPRWPPARTTRLPKAPCSGGSTVTAFSWTRSVCAGALAPGCPYFHSQ